MMNTGTLLVIASLGVAFWGFYRLTNNRAPGMADDALIVANFVTFPKVNNPIETYKDIPWLAVVRLTRAYARAALENSKFDMHVKHNVLFTVTALEYVPDLYVDLFAGVDIFYFGVHLVHVVSSYANRSAGSCVKFDVGEFSRAHPDAYKRISSTMNSY